MADLFDWCKERGELRTDQEVCVITRPPLLALLAASPLSLKLTFWLFFVGGILFYRLLLYVSYICVLLAVVETRSESPASPPPPDNREGATTRLRSSQREENRLWDSDSEDHEPSLIIARPTACKRTLRQCASACRTWIRILRSCLITDPADKRLVTKDLATCLAYLQYIAADSWWPLRGIGSYLEYSVLTRRFFVGVVSLALWVVVIICQLGYDMFSTPWGASSSIKAWAPSWPFVFIAATVCGLDPYNGFAFHTLRVISRATGVETNFVTLNIYDPKIVGRPPRGVITLTPTARSAMAYCLALYLTNLIPWLLFTRRLELEDSQYWITSDPQSGINLILARPTSRQSVICGYLAWFAMRLVILSPFFVFMVFDQAQLLPKEEAAIVGFRRIEKWSKLSYFQKTVLIVHRVGWRRWFRLGVQIGLVIAAITAVLSLLAWLALSQMPNIDLIIDWVVREYLDFGLELTLPGVLKNSFFWAYWNKNLVDKAGWGWFLGPDDTVPVL